MKNPYLGFVKSLDRLMGKAAALPLGGIPDAKRPRLRQKAPKVLIFSPHPDDECIVGGLALRLLREQKMRVINVAVTQGSNRERQAGRLAELQDACRYLGFELLQTAPSGLERINAKTRSQDPGHWAACVDGIARILSEQRPAVILVPHAGDWNSSHIGTHHLVMDALQRLGPAFACHVVETEFWAPMGAPNLMVEISQRDLADLMAALSFHVGEVQRNPYHLTLPAWMQDNVRRGGEVVGGQGGKPPSYRFATLYRLSRWSNGALAPAGEGGRLAGAADDIGALFAV